MVIIDEYMLTQHIKENRIVITLPQTIATATNTVVPIKGRRQAITEAEETALLVCVKAMFENCGAKMDEVEE